MILIVKNSNQLHSNNNLGLILEWTMRYNKIIQNNQMNKENQENKLIWVEMAQ